MGMRRFLQGTWPEVCPYCCVFARYSVVTSHGTCQVFVYVDFCKKKESDALTRVLLVVLAMVNEIMWGTEEPWYFVSLAWGDGEHSNGDPFPGYQYWLHNIDASWTVVLTESIIRSR